VIAFHDPITIDFRAPTIAWHVADDGAIDPEGFQQLPGLPPTLDAMVAAFGQDATEPAVASVAATTSSPSPSGDDPWPTIIVIVLVSGCVLAVTLALGRRPRRAQ
jgi:hypothetical protein